MSPFIISLILCTFSIHACNARYLRSIHMETKQDFSKDVEKVTNLHEAILPSEIIFLISSKFGGQKREEVGILDRKFGANTLQNILHVFWKEGEGTVEITSSGEKPILSSQKDLQRTVKLEGLKRQERSMLEAATSDIEEEAVKSNETDVTEDVVVMDYAQPHRKPPIHNEKA